jgi:galactokinase
MRSDTLHAAAVERAFSKWFGREPDGVWAAPGRVNLVGEHTDYNDGFVLPLAVDRQVTLAAARRDDDLLRVVSVDRGTARLRLADVAPGTVDGWAAYLAGALWSLAQTGVAVSGLDVVLSSDVPVGSGLSSSAAVACATVLAARDLYGGPDDPSGLALIAQRAENQIVGMPCGIMDQMASMACAADHALFLDAQSLAAEQVPLALAAAGLALLVIDTRAAHQLVDGAYAERRSSCEEAAAILSVAALRHTTEADLIAARDRLGDLRYRRARHVVTENARVLAVVEHLRHGRPELVGSLLTSSHASLRDDYEVSIAELDTVVDAALDAGALGARMTGAGFGGCAIALVPTTAVDSVTAAVTAAFAARGFTAPVLFPAYPSAGARRIA